LFVKIQFNEALFAPCRFDAARPFMYVHRTSI
jgi:hypothetical protein